MLENMNKPTHIVLDPKYKIFADTFLATGEKGKSARKAGFSARSAHVTANRLLKRADVQAYLQAQAAKVTEETEDIQSKVMNELSAMAFANIADFIRIDADGEPQVDFTGATPEQLRAIKSVASKRRTTTSRSGDVTTEQESKFEMADKYRGLELIMRRTGMLQGEEHKITIDVADRLLAARARLRSANPEEAE